MERRGPSKKGWRLVNQLEASHDDPQTSLPKRNTDPEGDRLDRAGPSLHASYLQQERARLWEDGQRPTLPFSPVAAGEMLKVKVPKENMQHEAKGLQSVKGTWGSRRWMPGTLKGQGQEHSPLTGRRRHKQGQDKRQGQLPSNASQAGTQVTQQGTRQPRSL